MSIKADGMIDMKYRLILVLSIIIFIAATAVLLLTELPVSDVKLISGGKTNDITLPSSESKTGLITYRMTIVKNSFSRNWVRIVPDDCLLSIKTNGGVLPQKGYVIGSTCDWGRGFTYPLGLFLNPGTNNVEMVITNSGGNSGLNIMSADTGAVYYFYSALFLLSMLGISFFILKKMKLCTPLILIFLAGIIIRCIYYAETPWNVRSHDVDSHIAYFQYLAAHFAIPDRNAGFVFYHPPLYYILAAGLYKLMLLFTGTNYSSALRGMQFSSLVLNFIYLIAGIKIIQISFRNIQNKISLKMITGNINGKWFHIKKLKKLFSGDFLILLASSLFVLWPSGILHSIRIGNDALVYPLYALSLLYIIKWERDKSPRLLIISSILASLAVVTKTNSVLMIGIIGILYLLDFFKNFRKPGALGKSIRQGVIISVIFMISIGIGFSGNIINMLKNHSANILAGNTGTLSSGLKVENNPANYLYFDSKIFITEPYTSAWDDKLGRQYFWNFLLKSSLFGEFSYPGPYAAGYAQILSFLLLWVLILTISGLFLWKKKDLYRDRVILINLAVSIASVMVFRISAPYSCSGDFRFILPAVISSGIIYARNVQLMRARGWYKAAAAAVITAALFVVCTVCFFIAIF
jgi:hypothetical protein